MTVRRPVMLLSAVLLTFVTAQPASALQVLGFSQVSATNTVTSLAQDLVGADGINDTTTITGTDVAVNVGNFYFGGSPFSAVLDLNAISTGPANVTLGGNIEQAFSGTFSILSADSSVNYLSGSFTNFALVNGSTGATGFILFGSTPTATISFTSDFGTFFPQLVNGFAFTNAIPSNGVAIDGTTLSSFTAAVAGTFSADVIREDNPVPEPGSMILLGTGLMGLAASARRRLRRK